MPYRMMGWVSRIPVLYGLGGVWHPCSKPLYDVGSQVGLWRRESAARYCQQPAGDALSLCPDFYHFSLKWAEPEALKFVSEKGYEL